MDAIKIGTHVWMDGMVCCINKITENYIYLNFHYKKMTGEFLCHKKDFNRYLKLPISHQDHAKILWTP